MKEMRRRDCKNFLQTIREGEKTWESCDPPYEPFVRYCNIRKTVKEIISTSEEDINIYPELIEMLYFWAPDLEIEQKKNKVPEKETIYEHLAKYYFDVDTVTSEDIAKSKKLTMVNLYGQISQQYCNIPYFAKVNELKDKYWQKFEKNGYITTPVYKRKITNKHIIDPNRNKLFSYIIQGNPC